MVGLGLFLARLGVRLGLVAIGLRLFLANILLVALHGVALLLVHFVLIVDLLIAAHRRGAGGRLRGNGQGERRQADGGGGNERHGQADLGQIHG